MIDYLGMVKEFHEMFGGPIGTKPRYISGDLFASRIELITEEFHEYCKAHAMGDLVDIADALGDLLVVVFGTALAHGLPMDEIFKRIHESNMTKKDGHLSPSGKWIKPIGWKPPQLEDLLE